jgi:hypothetical protein
MNLTTRNSGDSISARLNSQRQYEIILQFQK